MKLVRYFTRMEWTLWLSSAALILLSFLLFDRSGYLTLAASLIGVTSIILNAKGNPIGQALMIGFSLFYGWISFSCAYYGEMITYLGMSGPMALLALISWLRHPYKGRRAEVEIAELHTKDILLMLGLTAVVTVAFYFILAALNTAKLAYSTLSVATSFMAVYLTARRSPYFALAYAANDAVLIVLWVLAGQYDTTYIPVIICFVAFLANDIYGFINWRRMHRRQKREPV